MALDTPIQSMGNTVVLYDGHDITAALQAASLQATIDELETTNLASTAVETRPAPSKWSIAFNGYWSRELDDIIAPDVLNPPANGKPASIEFGDATGGKVKYDWAAKAFISNWSIGGGAPADYIPHDTSLNVSGAPQRTSTPGTP